MQLDMHYYATYAIARAAGLTEPACQIIAYAAQYVDDNAANDSADFEDAGRIDSEATAHHPVDHRNVMDEKDQRRVWVPFHFLPGNEGESFTEKLKCRQDSLVAQEMLEHYVEASISDFGIHLIGVAAHVYEDTFSHYGFSGISSRGNRVDQSSIDLDGKLSAEIRNYIEGKAQRFFKAQENEGLMKNIKSGLSRFVDIMKANVAESFGALGHGPVATYPDRPFLSWRFNYEDGSPSGWRHNQVSFLLACEKLHQFFVKVSDVRSDIKECEATPFDSIKPEIAKILATKAEKSVRINAWQVAATNGVFRESISTPIPEYSPDDWSDQWKGLKGTDDSMEAKNTDIFKFYQAAAFHRTYVLRDLLPKHGLVVD